MIKWFIYASTTILIAFSFAYCDENLRGTSPSLVSTVARLNSPNNKYSFYRYYVESSMAFGSGTVRMAILPVNEDFEYMSTNFFTLEGYGPVVQGWKNDSTLKLILFAGWPNANQEPFLTETKKVKNITLDISYHNLNSSGTTEFRFDSFELRNDTVAFLNGTKSKVFVKGIDEISFYSDTFKIKHIQIDYDSNARTKIQVNSENWKLIPQKKMDLSNLLQSGVLIETDIK